MNDDVIFQIPKCINKAISSVPICTDFVTWYDNIIGSRDGGTRLKIEFDRILTEDDLGTLFPRPGMSKAEIKDLKAKPFIVKKDIRVRLWYGKNKADEFTIKEGYRWDGASIPWLFRPVVGSPTYSGFKVASLLHDYLCENRHLINNDRYMSTIIYDALLQVGGVPAIIRWLKKHPVDNFQKTQGWRKK